MSRASNQLARILAMALVATSALEATAFAQDPSSGQTSSNSSGTLTDHQLLLKNRALAANQNYLEIIQRHAAEYGVDAALVMAVITVESDGNPNSLSSSGAMGLMQLMPGTCSDLNVSNPYDPEANIRGGVALLASHSHRYKGDLQRVLAAYNAGPRHADDGSWILISETRRYVPTVLAYYAVLKGTTDTTPTFAESAPVVILPPDPALFNTPPPRFVDMMIRALQTSQNVADPGGLAENGAFDDVATSLMSDYADGKITAKNLQAKALTRLAALHKKPKTLKAFLLTSSAAIDFTTEWDKQPPTTGNILGLSHGTSPHGHVWVVLIGTL